VTAPTSESASIPTSESASIPTSESASIPAPESASAPTSESASGLASRRTAGSLQYGSSKTRDSVTIQWIILLILSAIPIAIWIFAPSYGNTVLMSFLTTLSIVGGVLCLIAAVSIMMNIYKVDGAPIMIMMGFLGALVAPLIVVGYWIYHVWAWFRSIPPRPYFGLFPLGFYGDSGSWWDSLLAPFHDSSNDKPIYEELLRDARNILYSGPRG